MAWHKILDHGDLDEGRVATVTVGRTSLAVTHHEGRYGALNNACPHQGGPLGEGSIEQGLLRCPWHGYDYDPLTGSPPPPFDDAPSCYAVEVRDGGIYVDLPDEPTRERTVSDVLVETMVNWGIDTVFGMVGHSNLGFADALREAEARGDLRYIAIRHEGAAAFAASAYGKLTGRPAACFAIAGPGSTNLLTGLYDARADRAPVLAISGQVPSRVRGRGAFQDLDLTTAFSDVAAYSNTVSSDSDPAELMTLACKAAVVERGVAHLVLPDEVQVIPSDADPGSPVGRTGDVRVLPSHSSLDAARAAVLEARRPVFIVGHGARGQMEPIIELGKRCDAPILTTFKGKGLIPDSHPLAGGVLGRSGTPVASWLMNEADLLVVWGASFSNHTGIAEYKKTIQVDFDPSSLGRFHPVDVPVLGHVGVTAERMLEGMPSDLDTIDQRRDVAERWRIWNAEKQRRAEDESPAGASAAAVFAALSELAPEDAVIAVDVGNNTYSFGRYFESKGQPVLMSGYLGSIGFGYPAALGAWAADPSRPVIAVTGDGGFGQYMAEVNTAVLHGIPIKHILLSNGELGKISKEQRAAHFDVWQTTLSNPDFAAYARNCGALGVRVDSNEALRPAMAEVLAHDGPATLEVVTDSRLV